MNNKEDAIMLNIVAEIFVNAWERKWSEQALIASEQRFRELFYKSPDAIFVEDFNGKVLDINPAACRLHGLRREGIIGKSVLELVPPDKREEVVRDFAKLVKGESDHLEGFSRAANGHAIPVEITVSHTDYSGNKDSANWPRTLEKSSGSPLLRTTRCFTLAPDMRRSGAALVRAFMPRLRTGWRRSIPKTWSGCVRPPAPNKSPGSMTRSIGFSGPMARFVGSGIAPFRFETRPARSTALPALPRSAIGFCTKTTLQCTLPFLFATVVNDILDANGVIQTGHFVHLGMFIFIFAHAFMLSLRYSRAFRTIALQRLALEKSNLQSQDNRCGHMRLRAERLFYVSKRYTSQVICYKTDAYLLVLCFARSGLQAQD